MDSAKTATNAQAALARTSGMPSHGPWPTSGTVQPSGQANATQAAAAARPASTDAWRTVGGVSGRPKQPQLASGPPRCRATTTNPQNAT